MVLSYICDHFFLKIEEMLMKVDEQPLYARYKIGVILCRKDQSTEEQMYNNGEREPDLRSTVIGPSTYEIA